MIRHSPCEYFLKFLIIHPDGLSNAAIKERLFELGLDDLGDYYVEQLRKKLRPPSPFYPNDKLHFRSQRFLLKEGIQDLFFPDADTEAAYHLLDKPRLKEFVESMLLANAPPSAISFSLTRDRKFRASERAIEIFKLFFWNIELLDSVQVRALISMRAGLAGRHANDDIKMQEQALKHASWNDPRRSAAELPHAPLSAVMAQMRMGIMPASFKLTEVLEQTRVVAAMTAYEALCLNGAQDHIKVRNLTDSVRSLTEVLEVVVKPDENMREQLAQIALRTSENKVPHIHKLSQGRHTVDLQPKVEEDVHVGEPSEISGAGSPSDPGDSSGTPGGGPPPEVPPGG